MPLLCILSPIAAIHFPFVVIGALALNIIARILYRFNYEKRTNAVLLSFLCNLALIIFAIWSSIKILNKGLEMHSDEQAEIDALSAQE